MELIANLAHEIDQGLSAKLLAVLQTAGGLCSERGEHLYLVGGAVRDLILGRRIFDLDIVVEGDAGELAKSLVMRKGGAVVLHPRFGTSKVHHGDSTLDFATARAESYSRPGALPTVRQGTIEEDLLRRDFTVNAMAVRLGPDSFGDVIDPCRGQEDLKRGWIRVLHDRSFIDDATRMLRALRYEQRLGFQLEPRTEELLRRDIGMLATISGDRIRHELELIFTEEEPEKVIARADDLGVLREIYPILKGKEWLEEKLRRARSGLSPVPTAVCFCLMAYHLTSVGAKEFAERLKLPKTVSRAVDDTIRLRDNLSALTDPELPRSVICQRLEGYNIYSIMTSAIAEGNPLVSERLQLYVDKLRHVKPLLRGKALQEMGLAPGERLGELLRDLRWAKMDERVRTKKDEEELVLSWLSEGQGG